MYARYESFKYTLRRQQGQQDKEHDDTGRDSDTSGNNQNSSTHVSRSNSFQGAGLYFNNHTSSPVLLKVTTS